MVLVAYAGDVTVLQRCRVEKDFVLCCSTVCAYSLRLLINDMKRIPGALFLAA